MTALLRTLLSLALSGSVLILLLLLLAAPGCGPVPAAGGSTISGCGSAASAGALCPRSQPDEPALCAAGSGEPDRFPPGGGQRRPGTARRGGTGADSEAVLPGTDPLPEENAGESPSAGSSPTGSPDGDTPAGTTDYPGTGAPGGLTLPDAGQLAQAAAPAVLALWLGTALVLLIRRGLSYRSFVRAVRREARPVDDRLCWAVCAVPPAGRGYAMR